MTLTPGTRIGSYEVAEQIGVGGMGEVYRATDTNLKRQVAIKVLPEALADDPERLARFQREAEVLASLNHPNIAQIHGLERGESAIALVMELVDGPTLADRIAAGPVPVDEALAIARQIAEALEAAHEQRIIHRDLKPANIKLRPDGMVKVLDFGLAKAMSPAASISPAGTMSPTITTPAMTQAGLILGTAAYMSPEQAKGREADRRSDVWAFGCVLFEMLTGQRAFGGDEMSEVFASVLAREPALAAVPEDVPERIRKVVAACLRKDPRQRIHDIGDARLALEGVFETTVRDESVPVAVRPPLWLRAAPYVAIAALAVALAVVVWRPASVPEVVRFQVHAPPGETLPFGVPAVSPDGRTLAYTVVGADGLRRLHVRDLDTVETRALPGSEGALYSFWAPDGRSLGFISLPDRVLRRVDIRAGSPRDLVADILFNYDLGSIELAAVGTETRTTVLENGESAPVLAPTPGGTTYLLYMLAPDLMAQEYDEASGTVRGEPSVLVSEIAQVALPAVRPAVGVSAAGVLAYQAGRETSEGRLRWVDVQGNPLDLLPEESPLEDPRLSPDESSVVGTRFDADGNQDVWQTDLARLSTSRVTFSEDRDTAPVWSPDGQRLAIRRVGREGGLYVIDLDRGERRLSDRGLRPSSWSPDGNYLLANDLQEMWLVSVEGEEEMVRVGSRNGFARRGEFSPDGNYIAFVSDESGRDEVYVVPTPPAEGRQEPVSIDGGSEPRWRADGQELFFLSPSRSVMSVEVDIGERFSAGIPRELFTVSDALSGSGYDVSGDGQRFLFPTLPGSEGEDAPITVVLNWWVGLEP